MLERAQLVESLDQLLQTKNYKDYGPNGLQVEGRELIKKVVTGVTASEALIQAAIENNADAILVHHGLFWRGQDGTVKGWMKKRLSLLLANNINLLAYHLPLDDHHSLGNNAQLGLQLGLVAHSRFGDQNLGFIGDCNLPSSVALADLIQAKISPRVTVVGPVVKASIAKPLQVAWCTGGAQSYFESAIAKGAQVFITGEISEPQMHYAEEMGVSFIACGHHATERYGVQALGQWLVQNYAIDHQYIDIYNPA